MIFFAALGIAVSLLGYTCFTLRIMRFPSMMVSHFVTYYLIGLGACYYLETDTKTNLILGGLGLLGGLAWYVIVKLFGRVEERFGRNDVP